MTQILFGERIGSRGRIRLGCVGLLFDPAREKVMLTRRADNGQWCLPSGGLEPGESVSEACQRETLEETGLSVRVTRLIGIFSSPDRLVIYDDGSQFQFISLCFEVEWIQGETGLSDETIEVGYFALPEIESMDLFPHHRQFILDALQNRAEAFLR